MSDFVQDKIDRAEEWRYRRRMQAAIENSRASSIYFPKSNISSILTDPFGESAEKKPHVMEDLASKLLFRQELERLAAADYDSNDMEVTETPYPLVQSTAVESLRLENEGILNELESIFTEEAVEEPTFSHQMIRSPRTIESRSVFIPDDEITKLEESLREYEIGRKSDTLATRIENELSARIVENIVLELTEKELSVVAKDMIESSQPESIDFGDFDDELVQEALYGGPTDEVLIQKFNVDLKRRDLLCLEPATWLNDEVINFWFQLLDDRDQKAEGFGRSHFFSSFFYTKLTERGSYNFANVRRWTRKFDLFSRDKVFVPVNVSNTHWCLAVIFMNEKKIQYYDSMNGSGMTCLKHLLHYLEDEIQHKKKVKLDDKDEWRLVRSAPDTPQQMNGFDCGVFACTFADCLSLNQALQFSQSDMPMIRRRMVAKIVEGEI